MIIDLIVKFNQTISQMSIFEKERGKWFVLLLLIASLPAFTLWNDYQSQPDEQRLLPMMKTLMVQMNRINTGIYMEDYTLIDTTAFNIAHHPKIATEQLKKIKKALGKQMKTFKRYDLKMVHSHADSMSLAAQQKNMQKVLDHYEIVQRGCVGCHIDFRTKLKKVLHPQQE